MRDIQMLALMKPLLSVSLSSIKARLHCTLKRALGALVLPCVMSYGGPSHACFIAVERKVEDVALADAVFVGELMKYDVIKPRGKFDLSAYAVLTFVIEERIGGELNEKRIEVYWHNSTFGMPSKLKLDRYLVAITTAKQPPLRGPSATIFASQRPDLPSVLQAPCADPFLLEPTKQNLEQVKNLLKERHLPQETK